jgi:enoyl-CoA hydratase/carnithine racemase
MRYGNYESLKVSTDRGVAFVTIDNPPINLFDVVLISDLDRLGSEMAVDDDTKVIVFESADPEFFIAHADVTLIQALPEGESDSPDEPNLFQKMVDRYRTMPKVTIAKIEGRARGGGSEFALSLDMRFAAIGKALLAQPEVALGIIPGGGGTQRLPRLMGRGRALEVILGCADFDAELAERYGYVNRALPSAEIGPFVDELARRIASFPGQAIALAKQAINGCEVDVHDGLCTEAGLFNRTLADPEAREQMQRFMDSGGQTRNVELNLESLIAGLHRDPSYR